MPLMMGGRCWLWLVGLQSLLGHGDTILEGVLPVTLLMKKLCRPLGYCSWRLTLQVPPRVDGRGRAVQHASESLCSSISLSLSPPCGLCFPL